MSNTNVKEIVKTVESEYQIHLDCDDYVVDLLLLSTSPYRSIVRVYVNGWIKGENLTIADSERELTDIARRFYSHRKRYLYTPAQVEKANKALGKRLAKRRGFTRDKYWISPIPEFRTARAAASHILKHNSRVQVLSKVEQKNRLAALQEAEA